MCVAVSEERGKISVARNGRLRQVDNMQELGSLLQRFLREKYPPPENRGFSFSLVREHWFTKVATFCLAIALWYVLVPGSSTVEAVYKVPVLVENLPPNLRVDDIQPAAVNATFTGAKRTFYFFDPGKLRVTLDMSTAEEGRKVLRLSEQNIRHPPTLTLQQLNPTTVRISLAKTPRQENDKG